MYHAAPALGLRHASSSPPTEVDGREHPILSSQLHLCLSITLHNLACGPQAPSVLLPHYRPCCQASGSSGRRAPRHHVPAPRPLPAAGGGVQRGWAQGGGGEGDPQPREGGWCWATAPADRYTVHTCVSPWSGCSSRLLPVVMLQTCQPTCSCACLGGCFDALHVPCVLPPPTSHVPLPLPLPCPLPPC